MKMRTRSQLDLAKRCFWIVLSLVVAWQLGLLKIGLIVLVAYFLLALIVGTITGKSAPEQQFTINSLHPPSEWKGVHDTVWDMFMTNTNDKDEVVVARFLHHINAIADEKQPLFQNADRAIYCKMTYEHQRMYGSLLYTYTGGLHVITGPETMRQLSNEERIPFIAFCQEQFAAWLKSFGTTDSARHQQMDDRSSPDAAV